MTLVLEESEEISTELLSPLLASVKIDNKVVIFSLISHYSALFCDCSHSFYQEYFIFFCSFRILHLLQGSWGRKFLKTAPPNSRFVLEKQ